MRMVDVRPVTVADMLSARDRRAVRQRRFLQMSPVLISFTMNIPGPVKTSPAILAAFREGVRRVERAVGVRPIQYEAFTGPEAYFPMNADAAAVKRDMCRIEDEEPLGRLYDLDVLSERGEKSSRAALGLPPRRCLLCGRPAFECARSRTHSVAELSREISRRIDEWQRATLPERIAEAAVRALICEAETTPKPGLVDRRNCGSHPDMNLEMLLQSARSLKPYFRECARVGLEKEEADAFPLLRALGIEAENTMLRATGGVNAHKGVIFSMGLLAASAAACLQEFEADAARICARAGRMAAPYVEEHLHSLRAETAHTFGDRLYLETGLRGARGEAAAGFPSVLKYALPALEASESDLHEEAPCAPEANPHENPVEASEAARASENRNDRWGDTPAGASEGTRMRLDGFSGKAVSSESKVAPGVYALLRLAAETDDTTLIRRGGLPRAQIVKNEIRVLLSSGLTRKSVEALDDQLIRKNLTLGGCADLLACAYFLMAAREI